MASMGDTTFSVIIPAFNVAPYIRECIESALKQTHNSFEVIVVDDCSTDGTADIVRAIHDSRLRLIVNEANSGVSYTRNSAIDAAMGEYIVLLDSDDLMAANRLEIIAGHLQDAPTMVFDDLQYFSGDAPEEGGETAYSRREISVTDVRGYGFEEFLSKDLGILQATIRKSFLAEQGIRYEQGFSAGEDFAFYADIFLAGGTVRFIGEALYFYRQREGSLIRTASERTYTSLASTTKLVLDRHSDALKSLPTAKALLVARHHHQTGVLNYHRLTTRIKQRNLIGAISIVIKEPRAAAALGKKALGKLLPATGK